MYHVVFSHSSRRSPGEGNGYPLQNSCLENLTAEEPGGLQSIGSQRAMTEQLTLSLFFTFIDLLYFTPFSPKGEIWLSYWRATVLYCILFLSLFYICFYLSFFFFFGSPAWLVESEPRPGIEPWAMK